LHASKTEIGEEIGEEIQSGKLLHLIEPDYNFTLDTLLEIDRKFEIRLSGKLTYLNVIFSASHCPESRAPE